MQKNKTFLITGGAGFIGSALIRHLLKQHNFLVINLDKLTYSGNLESLESVEKKDNYVFERGDICNSKALIKIFTKYRPDIIIHLAAESHVDRSIENPENFIHTNIIGTYTLLEQSLKYFNSLKKQKKLNFRFLHVSTDEVYGDLGTSSKFFTEDSSYNPSSPYSASKASSDHLVRAWFRTFGLPVLITNCSNNYGPFQFPEKLIPHVILNAIKGKEIPIYGDGKQVRDWLYVEDHIKALMTVALEGRIGETYNIGGNNAIQNIELVKELCSILDEFIPEKLNGLNSFNELINHVEDRPGHDLCYAIDASKISKDLGWIQTEDFISGIRKTVDWYLENIDWSENILNGSYKLDRIGVKLK